MKITSLLVLLAAGALAWTAWSAGDRTYVAPTPEEIAMHDAAPQELAGVVPAGFEVQSFAIEGMCCEGCTGKLYTAVKSLPVVKAAAVSFERGCAEVVVPAGTEAKPLAAALSFGKYTAAEQ